MNRRLLAPALWGTVIFGTSCTVITRRQWLTSVHEAAPTVATPSELDQFWTRYWWVFVKGYHVLEYAILFTLCAWANHWRRDRIGPIALACLLFAVSDEIHQLFVDHRGGSITDVLIDALGVVLAGLLVRWIRKPVSQDVARSRPAAGSTRRSPSS